MPYLQRRNKQPKPCERKVTVMNKELHEDQRAKNLLKVPKAPRTIKRRVVPNCNTLAQNLNQRKELETLTGLQFLFEAVDRLLQPDCIAGCSSRILSHSIWRRRWASLNFCAVNTL
jgi:hypothetical protein